MQPVRSVLLAILMFVAVPMGACTLAPTSLRKAYRAGEFGPQPKWEVALDRRGQLVTDPTSPEQIAFAEGLRDLSKRYGPADPWHQHYFHLMRGGLVGISDDNRGEYTAQLARFEDGVWRELDMSPIQSRTLMRAASSPQLMVFSSDSGLQLWSWGDDDRPRAVSVPYGMIQISSSGKGTWVGFILDRLCFGTFDENGQLVLDPPLPGQRIAHTTKNAIWLDSESVLLRDRWVLTRKGAVTELPGELHRGRMGGPIEEFASAMRRAVVVRRHDDIKSFESTWLLLWQGEEFQEVKSPGIDHVSPGGGIVGKHAFTIDMYMHRTKLFSLQKNGGPPRFTGNYDYPIWYAEW